MATSVNPRAAERTAGSAGRPRRRGVARAVAGQEARLEALRERREIEHQELLAAALRAFVARGYADTRVEDVLREAGISTRAFYRFHAGKDELFLELFARANDAAMARLGDVVSRQKSPPARLDAYIDATLDLAYEPRYRRETKLFSSVPAELRERYSSEVRACQEQLVGLLVEIVTAGRASGDFPKVEPAEDAWALHGVLAGTLTRVLSADEPPPRDRLSRHLRRFCRAALARG
ncbi:MAG: TetR/AcrR family transcriptional regulator [Deltaproteobacteria bacterium]|nr:TetR/AcrR family transcriptional regulator [Deltaproteobacteria bacterium]